MRFQRSNTRALIRFRHTLRRFGIDIGTSSISERVEFVETYGGIYRPVMIVGSNPSVASPDNTPFHEGTKSRKTIDSWLNMAEFNHLVRFANVVNYKKVDNKPLTKKEINDHLGQIRIRFSLENSWKIVAVGKDAQYGLEKAGIPHFKMPHPSGINRFWNDKEAGEAKIKEMLEWLKI